MVKECNKSWNYERSKCEYFYGGDYRFCQLVYRARMRVNYFFMSNQYWSTSRSMAVFDEIPRVNTCFLWYKRLSKATISRVQLSYSSVWVLIEGLVVLIYERPRCKSSAIFKLDAKSITNVARKLGTSSITYSGMPKDFWVGEGCSKEIFLQVWSKVFNHSVLFGA